MAIIMFLYLAIILVLINLIVQVALYLKDIKERISLKMSLSRQIKPREASIKFVRVGKIRSS